MIKFFRKVRQKLVDQGSLRKYLLYAFGEIVLVVIGILIALQINDWNEKRKNDSTAGHYLTSLKEEFEFNKESLKTLSELNDRNAINGLEILKYTGPKETKIVEESFDSLIISTIGSEVQLRPRNEIIDEVISSGKLSIFSNSELRTALSSWSGALKRVRFQEEELSKYRFQVLDLSMKSINIRNAIFNATGGIFGITKSEFEKNNKSILKSQEFESTLTSFIGASKFADQRFKELDKKINEILYLINQELK